MNDSEYKGNEKKQDLKNQDVKQRTAETRKSEYPSGTLNKTESRSQKTDINKKTDSILSKSDSKLKKVSTSEEVIRTSNKFDKLFGENTANEELVSQETIGVPNVNLKSAALARKSVTIKKSSKVSDEVFEPEVETDDDDEFVWVEEEIEEEVEVETDEDEIDEEDIEEEIEEETFSKTIEGEKKVKGEEELSEEEEEFIEEVPEDLEVGDEKQIKEQEISDAEVEEVLEEEKIEEEEIEAVEEEGEYEKKDLNILEKVKVELPKKKLKFVKVIKMVKKRKKDILLKLQQKSEIKDEEYEKFKEREKMAEELKKEEEEELKKKEEAARKEREEKLEEVKGVVNELVILKKKNKVLSRGIIDYYRMRKNENVQETEHPSTELLNKYNKRLKLFSELKKAVSSEILRMNEELSDLQRDLNVANEECESAKNDLNIWIADIGKNVIVTQTGKPLEESVVQHVVQRAEAIAQQIRYERLIQVTLASEMAEYEAALKELVAFEGDLSLIDYEQLRLDNQTFSEKIEERENELAHLRKKIFEIIHTGAHVSEKTDAITEDIERYNNQVLKMNQEMSALRRKVTKLKTTRDQLRSETSKLRKESGLLTRPKLALDYELSDLKIVEARNKTERLVKKFKKQKLIIENLRKEITDATAYNDLF